MVLTSSNRITFSLDNDICKGSVQSTSVVMVSLLPLASYVVASCLFGWTKD